MPVLVRRVFMLKIVPEAWESAYTQVYTIFCVSQRLARPKTYDHVIPECRRGDRHWTPRPFVTSHALVRLTGCKELNMSTQAVQAVRRHTASKGVLIFDWACRAVAAVILLQTLFFKFTAAPESVYIFTKVGGLVHSTLPFISIAMAEKFGRLGSGVMELMAGIMLIAPRYVWAGAVLAMAATFGAIATHLTVLGIDVLGDKGLLFGLAVTVFVTSATALYIHRADIPVLGKRFQ
jgi:putative oxidoreductase